MGLCTPSFFGTTAKCCSKCHFMARNTPRSAKKNGPSCAQPRSTNKNMFVGSYLAMATKKIEYKVPRKGPLIFLDIFRHLSIPQDSQLPMGWKWGPRKIRCWQIWLNAQRPTITSHSKLQFTQIPSKYLTNHHFTKQRKTPGFFPTFFSLHISPHFLHLHTLVYPPPCFSSTGR